MLQQCFYLVGIVPIERIWVNLFIHIKIIIMFPNQSVLNEEYDYEDKRQNALSYASVKKLLSPPANLKV